MERGEDLNKEDLQIVEKAGILKRFWFARSNSTSSRFDYVKHC